MSKLQHRHELYQETDEIHAAADRTSIFKGFKRTVQDIYQSYMKIHDTDINMIDKRDSDFILYSDI